MGAAIYLKLSQPIEGVDDLFAGGKAISNNSEALNQVANHAGVPTLLSFFCEESREELEDLAESMDSVPESLLTYIEHWVEKWFEADEGIATANALLAGVRAEPEKYEWTDSLIDELTRMETALSAAERGIRFHTVVDY